MTYSNPYASTSSPTNFIAFSGMGMRKGGRAMLMPSNYLNTGPPIADVLVVAGGGGGGGTAFNAYGAGGGGAGGLVYTTGVTLAAGATYVVTIGAGGAAGGVAARGDRARRRDLEGAPVRASRDREPPGHGALERDDARARPALREVELAPAGPR